MIKFGDIFRHNEHLYVYLGDKNGIIYTARILNKEQSGPFIKRRNDPFSVAKSPKGYSTLSLCFVELQTSNFTEQIAHLANSDAYVQELDFDKLGSLDKIDKDNIKKEVLDSEDSLPTSLVSMIREMQTKD